VRIVVRESESLLVDEVLSQRFEDIQCRLVVAGLDGCPYLVETVRNVSLSVSTASYGSYASALRLSVGRRMYCTCWWIDSRLISGVRSRAKRGATAGRASKANGERSEP
jgi:hypothetical protein